MDLSPSFPQTAEVGAPPPVFALPVERRSSLNSVGPWLTIAVGGALLVGGVVTGILANAADKDFTSHCPTLKACDPSLKGTQDDALRLGRITDVLVTSGAIITAGGVTWRLLTPATPGPSSGRTLLVTAAGVY